MKRFFVMGKQIMLAAVLFAGLSLTSCDKDDDEPEEPQQEQPTPNPGDKTEDDDKKDDDKKDDEENKDDDGEEETPNTPVEVQGLKLDLSEGSESVWSQFCDVEYNEDGSVTLTMSKGEQDWQAGEFGFIIPSVDEQTYKEIQIKYKDASAQAGVGMCIHYNTTTAGWVNGESDNKATTDIEAQGTIVVTPNEAGDMQTVRFFGFATGNKITVTEVIAVPEEGQSVTPAPEEPKDEPVVDPTPAEPAGDAVVLQAASEEELNGVENWEGKTVYGVQPWSKGFAKADFEANKDGYMVMQVKNIGDGQGFQVLGNTAENGGYGTRLDGSDYGFTKGKVDGDITYIYCPVSDILNIFPGGTKTNWEGKEFTWDACDYVCFNTWGAGATTAVVKITIEATAPVAE